ncbi:MAG: hypothetical protein AMJ42_00760 [Deltaproteobacteria bacterium DG_8]|nr:MAG: hypothetical protein AMJ42_00760 [Deltaproteobacteria bacterium DG_8]
MKWGRTLLLIVVLVTLSGYFYFYEIKGAAKRRGAEEKRKEDEWREIQIFPYQPQDFKKIRLMKDNKTIVYQKEEQVWWMKEPMNIKGDEKAVDDIIQSIINVVECDPVTDGPSDLVQFGLDRPRMEISIHLEGVEDAKTLLLGNDNPTFITIYAKLKGSPKVFLVGSLIRWEVSKEFYNLDHRTGPFFSEKKGA